MRTDDSLEIHPEVAVVEVVVISGGGRAGDDRPTATRRIDARRESVLAGVLEDDIGIVTTGQVPDGGAETSPFLAVGRSLLPELEVLGVTIDDQLCPHPP